MIVALDGPAGAGKSTVAKMVAERLGFQLVETGALYRAVGLLARERGVALHDASALASIADSLALRFEHRNGMNAVYVGEREVTEALRTEQAGADASIVSALPEVRAALLDLQRTLAAACDSVLEGRDIGTVVCPDAALKFYITASPEVRAKRRVQELHAKGVEADYSDVLSDIIARDDRDMNRAIAPLRPAEDATYIDSSAQPIEVVYAQVEAKVLALRSAGDPEER